MNIKSLAMASAGLALISAPVAANAATTNPASSLSLSKATRAGSPTSKTNKVAGVSTVPLVIGAAIVAGVTYLIVDNEDDDNNSDSN